MATSRRNFIKTSALVAISAGIPLKAAAEQLERQSVNMSNTAKPMPAYAVGDDRLNLKAFSKALKSEFLVRSESGGTAVRLIEVKDLRSDAQKASSATATRECFSTVFMGPKSASLKQETYKVNHSSLGTFSLLLVPIGKDRNAWYYEAVFNRLH
jgi:hypothetical protein